MVFRFLHEEQCCQIPMDAADADYVTEIIENLAEHILYQSSNHQSLSIQHNGPRSRKRFTN